MLPQLSVKQDNVTMLQQFMGLNLNTRVDESEFSDIVNLTNDSFPVLSTRKKRGIISKLSKPQGMLGGRYLTFVDDNKLYYDENFICDLAVTNEKRQLVIMGAYLCVFPDGLIYNTYTEEISYIENTVTTSIPPTLTLCRLDGTNYNDQNTVTSDTEPQDRKMYWLDTSAEPVVLKVFSESLSSWVSVGTTYVKFESPGIGIGFKPYDAARFTDVDTKEQTTAIYNNIDFNNTNIIYDCSDNFVVVAGLINQVYTNSSNITIKREVPEIDYVCESSNRIWACSSKNHEIYACKLGDPTNWYCYAGLDSDSYAATVGTQNDFTGCVSYSGSVFFFKQDGWHKVYGTKPSNFEVSWKAGRGVQNGSSQSIAIVNDYLVFKARDSVCIYDGSTQNISEKLGPEPMYDAVAGEYRNKYYISMRDADYNWYLFVYDITKGTWVKEDSEEILYMSYANNGMYIVDYYGNLSVVNNEKIYSKLWPGSDLYPSENLYPGNMLSGDLEGRISWMFETGDIGLNSPFHKYIKRLNVRMWLDYDTSLKIEVMYDSTYAWEQIMEYHAMQTKTIEIPLHVQRCDHFRLRFTGAGDMKLFSIAKVLEEGSGI